jgi:hypothetical protein
LRVGQSPKWWLISCRVGIAVVGPTVRKSSLRFSFWVVGTHTTNGFCQIGAGQGPTQQLANISLFVLFFSPKKDANHSIIFSIFFRNKYFLKNLTYKYFMIFFRIRISYFLIALAVNLNGAVQLVGYFSAILMNFSINCSCWFVTCQRLISKLQK